MLQDSGAAQLLRDHNELGISAISNLFTRLFIQNNAPLRSAMVSLRIVAMNDVAASCASIGKLQQGAPTVRLGNAHRVRKGYTSCCRVVRHRVECVSSLRNWPNIRNVLHGGII